MLVALLVGALAGPLPRAAALPPPNDGPLGAAAFTPFTAENGIPHELQALAELAEATADPGVPRCLGATSFARTAWYSVPPAQAPQELTVEAMGATLDVVDLAAFVQPSGSTGPLTHEPNACSGLGSGGADAAEEPTSAVSLRVPAGRGVLIQTGRRGRVGSPADERALLSLDMQPAGFSPSPPGDVADARTPSARAHRATSVSLAGATITQEDPAQPPCPSLATVWRRIVPGRTGRRLITVEGRSATTVTVFGGRRPTAENALDCVNRSGRGSLALDVPGRRRRPLWIRIGTNSPPAGARATLRVADGGGAIVVDGGGGGFDPTTGGPGGGLPTACARAKVARARVAGARLSGSVAARNRRRLLPLAIVVRGGSVCDVQLRLFGPRGRVYALGRAIRLKKGRRVVTLQRVRRLRRGSYRLRTTAISLLGERVPVRTNVGGRLS
jgi:hypothetical protein